MLTHLSVHNYALIDKLDFDLNEGLTVITGETGAGKSILLGALSLILGQRADTRVLLDKTKKCIIEGTFKIKDYGLSDFFSQNELDYDDVSVIRREINQNGKSRAFINDTPVNLEVLKEIGEMLVDIHSQHKTLTLKESKFHLAFIDSYIQHDELLTNFRKEYFYYNKLSSELTNFLEKEKQSKTEQDYYQFLFDELDASNLKNSEQEELEQELKFLNHSEEIKLNLNRILFLLQSGNNSLSAGINEVCSILNKLAALHTSLSETSKRLDSCKIEINDIAGDIELLEQKITFNPEKTNLITERLNAIYNLQQKHRVNTVAELLQLKNDISEKLNSFVSLEQQIENVKNLIEKTEKRLAELSTQITKNRKQSIPKIEKIVTETLKKLAMPYAEFKITHTELSKYNIYGKDNILFLFNANKGGELKELSKVASGGELSRLMLSIKSMISVKKLLPTIIFDEIDQGISGETADKTGKILKNMSATMQVIAITHLPQIAVKGISHALVYKETKNDISCTKIRSLTETERITEIAKMLSGNKLTDAAMENAKALLYN